MCYNNEEIAAIFCKGGKGGWKMAGNGCIINPLCSRRGKAALALLLLALALGAGAALLFRPRDAETAPGRTPPEGLTAYDVTVKLFPERREISVTEEIAFRNDTGDPLTDLTLRAWLNAFRSEATSPAAVEEFYDACYPEGFSPGEMRVYDVLWNGERRPYAFDDEAGTVLRIAIPTLEAGAAGRLTLRFTARIPLCAHRTGGTGSIWQLGNVIPLLPLYQDHAWRTDPYSPIGDPFVNPCADFDVHVFGLPEDWRLACSAIMEKRADGGWHGGIRAARDIALCCGPDYREAEARAGNVRILAYAETEAGARRAAEMGRRAVETLSALYGPYPYPSLTVCSVDFPFGGMEYSGLVMVGRRYFLDSARDTLEMTVCHEAAHQWFYSLVGSDQVNAPWQDEALCQWAMLRCVRARYGQGSYENLKRLLVDAPMETTIPGSLTPGSPIDYFGALADYSDVVYGRGTAMLDALDTFLQGGVDGFLRALADTYAYRFVTRAEFEAFLNQYAGMDCSPLLLDYLDTAR